MYYQIIKSNKEEIGLVWQFISGKPQVEYIYLPQYPERLKDNIIRDYPEIKRTGRKIPDGIAKQIAQIYAGEKANIDLCFFNLSNLKIFAQKVLKQTCKIPSGKVTTYSALADQIGATGAARAVGTALANNPFPLIIPCHRVVRADGSLGGYGGGIEMKKELLRKEGVLSDDKGHVLEKHFFFG